MDLVEAQPIIAKEINNNSVDDEDEDTELEIYSIVKIQSLIRRFLIRTRALKEIFHRYEKIYDPKRKRYYYYDKFTNQSSWLKPPILLHRDLPQVAPTYLPEQAAKKLQKFIRKCLALHRVRLLYQGTITTIQDNKTGKRLYFNSKSGASYFKLPTFMKGRLDYRKHSKKKNKKKKDQKKGKKGAEDSDDDEEEDEDDSEKSDDDSEDETLDSEALRQRRRLKRKFPRSKLQLIIDQAEDNYQQTFELNLSNFGAYRFSSRIYDLFELKQLNLSYNHLSKLSANIQYLLKLKMLNASYNQIKSIPEDISEMKRLEELIIHHNKLSDYPASFYRLKNLKRIDFSYNEFTEVPLETGNLQLLKELGEWDVGIGLLKNLQFVNFSNNQITEFPLQIDRIEGLKELYLSHNQIEEIPTEIENLKHLIKFSIDHNQIKILPMELYLMPSLEIFHAENNMISALPNPFEHDTKGQSDGKNSQVNSTVISPRGDTNIIMSGQTSPLNERATPPPPSSSSSPFDIASPNSVTSKSKNTNRFADTNQSILSNPSIGADSSMTLKESKYPVYPYELTKLHTMDLSYNKFTHLTNELLIFKGLMELNLSHNQLTFIEDAAFGHCKQLRRLDLSYNQLTDLPITLQECKELTILTLSYNRFQHIPKSLIKCMKLLSLYLDHNVLTELDGKVMTMFYDLEHLELQSNSLKELSILLFSIKKLVYVDLSENEIQVLPAEIEAWEKIQYLDLSNNRLSALPTTIGRLAGTLQVFYLHHNLLLELPDTIYQLTKLQRLTLQFNRLSKAPYLLYSLPELLHCNLSHNDFEYVHDFRRHFLYVKRSAWPKGFISSQPKANQRVLGTSGEETVKPTQSDEIKIENNNANYREITYDIPHIRRDIFYLREYSDEIIRKLLIDEKRFHSRNLLPQLNTISTNTHEVKQEKQQEDGKANHRELFLHWLQKLRIHFNLNIDPVPLKPDVSNHSGKDEKKESSFNAVSQSFSFSYSTVSEEESSRKTESSSNIISIGIGAKKSSLAIEVDENHDEPSKAMQEFKPKTSSGFLGSFSFTGGRTSQTKPPISAASSFLTTSSVAAPPAAAVPANKTTPSLVPQQRKLSNRNTLSHSYSQESEESAVNRPSSAAPPIQMYLLPNGNIRFNHPKLVQQFFLFHLYSKWQSISLIRNQFFLNQFQLTTNRSLMDYNHDINNPVHLLPPLPVEATPNKAFGSKVRFGKYSSDTVKEEENDDDDEKTEEESKQEQQQRRYHYSKSRSLLQQNLSISSQKQLEKKLFGMPTTLQKEEEEEEGGGGGQGIDENEEAERKRKEEISSKLLNEICFFGSEELLSIIQHGCELISLINIFIYLEEFQTMKSKAPKTQWKKPSTLLSPLSVTSPPQPASGTNTASALSPLLLSPSESSKTLNTAGGKGNTSKSSLFSAANKQKRRSTDSEKEMNKKVTDFQKDLSRLLAGGANPTTAEVILTGKTDGRKDFDSNIFIDELLIKYGNLLDAEELLQEMIHFHYQQFNIPHDPSTCMKTTTETSTQNGVMTKLNRFSTSGDSTTLFNISRDISADTAPSRSRSLASFAPLPLNSPPAPTPPVDDLLIPTQRVSWILNTITNPQQRTNNILIDHLPLMSLPLSLIHSQERLIRQRFLSDTFGEANVPLTDAQIQSNQKKSQGQPTTSVLGGKKPTPAMLELMKKHEAKQKLRRSFMYELPTKNYSTQTNSHPRHRFQMLTESCYQDDVYSEYSIFSCLMEVYGVVTKCILLHIDYIEKIIRQIERQFLHQRLIEDYAQQQSVKSLSKPFTFLQLFSCMDLCQRSYYYAPVPPSEKNKKKKNAANTTVEKVEETKKKASEPVDELIEKKEDYDDIFYDIYMSLNMNMMSQQKKKESSANKSLSHRRQMMVQEFLNKFYSSISLESLGITEEKSEGKDKERDKERDKDNDQDKEDENKSTASTVSSSNQSKLQKQLSANSVTSNLTMEGEGGYPNNKTPSTNPLSHMDSATSFFSNLQGSSASSSFGSFLSPEEASDYLELFQEYRSLWYLYALQILQNYQEILQYRGFTPSLILEYYLKRVTSSSSSSSNNKTTTTAEMEQYHEKIIALIHSELQNTNYSSKNQTLFSMKVLQEETFTTSLLIHYRMMIGQLGKVYQGLGMYAAALDCFLQYLQLSKGMNLPKEFFLNLIKIFITMGNYYKAYQMMDTVIKRYIPTTRGKPGGIVNSVAEKDDENDSVESAITFSPSELLPIDREIAILYYYIVSQSELFQETLGYNLNTTIPKIQSAQQHQQKLSSSNQYLFNQFISVIPDPSYLYKIQNCEKLLHSNEISYENLHGRNLLDAKYQQYTHQEQKKREEKEQQKQQKIQYLNEIHSVKSKALLLLEDELVASLLKKSTK